MDLLFAAVVLAAAQTAPTGSVDHSRQNPAQHAEHQQGLQGTHQEHAEMMKHCHAMMARMHKSMHEGDEAQTSTRPDQHKHDSHR